MVAGAMGFLYEDPGMCFYMEDDAAGLVLRLALKTRFSEMGWGSTPLLSATFRMRPASKKIQLVIEK